MRSTIWPGLLVAVLFLAACGGQPDSVPATNDQAGEQGYLNWSKEATYVGRDVCGSCHVDRYESFTKTEMGRSFKQATLTNSVANFDHPDPIYDAENDLFYQPFHRGEDLFVREYRIAKGDTVHNRVVKIDYIVGSGQHTNSHIRDVNGYLYQVPVTWYVQQGVWDLAPGFKGHNTRFNRAIALECMSCHNAVAEYVPGSGNRFTSVPHGIDCERCHGPGSVHVEAIKAGKIVNTDEEIDRTIVNPRKLSIDRVYDVCQRCHMQGGAVLKGDSTFLSFRPGMDLSKVMNVFWPRYADSTKRFIMASHPDRLEMSKCFRVSHSPDSGYDPITCITCHNPHQSVNDVAAADFNSQCTTCHQPDRAPLCTEDLATRRKVDDDCARCHMPTSGTIDIPHIRITDHYIRVPKRGGASSTSGEEQPFIRLANLIENKPTLKAVGDGYLTFYEQFGAQPSFLDSAAVYLDRASQVMSEDELARSLIRLWFLQEKYGKVRELADRLPPQRMEDAWTRYRIGEAFMKGQQVKEAIRHYEQANRLAPQHLLFKQKLANAYISDQQLDRAKTMYHEIIAADSTQGDAYNNRGLLRVMLKDYEGAEADFKKAVSLDPDEEQALGNLASLYYNTGRRHLARPIVEHLIELSPNNTQYREFLKLTR